MTDSKLPAPSYLVTLLTFLLLLGGSYASFETLARANGDPASHVVPTRDVFLPSEPVVCSLAGRRLEAVTEATRKAGYPVKAVVIPTPEDLGTLRRLFGRPEAYARQLELELPAEMFEPLDGKRGYRLLILMPGGLGLNRADQRESRVLERIGAEGTASEEELARLATRAILQLARATGHGFRKPPPKSQCVGTASSDSGSLGAIAIGAVVVAMLALAWFLGRRGRTPRPSG
jgi:hypothetical protein